MQDNNTDNQYKPLKDYRILGNSGLRVSPICLGGMNFGEQWKNFMGAITYEEAEKIFNKYCDLGGNFIDTANVYSNGESEKWLGEFIKKRGNREELVIATKYTLPNPFENKMTVGNNRKSMYHAIKNSLKRLDMEYVDILYVHCWDWITPVKEVLRGLDDLVKSGLVHYLGISDSPAWQVSRMNSLAEAFGWSPFIVYQGRHNIGERTLEDDVGTMCREMGLGITPWNVLGVGKYLGKYDRKNGVPQTIRNNKITAKDFEIQDAVLEVAKEANCTPAQVIIQWELNVPGITSALIGSRTLEQFLDNVKALDVKLTEKQFETLNKVAEVQKPFPYDFVGHNYAENLAMQKYGK